MYDLTADVQLFEVLPRSRVRDSVVAGAKQELMWKSCGRKTEDFGEAKHS